MTEPLLDVSVSAGYDQTPVLDKLCFQLASGERAGVVGTSGAGKSTLIFALLGMLPWRGGWATGSVQMLGKDLLSCSEGRLRAFRGKDLALIPQSAATALNPMLSLQSHFDEMWRAHAERGLTQKARVQHLLTRLRLPSDISFLKRLPGQISIGQAQRVMIALALLHRPRLLLADEPTSALDVCTQEEIIRLLHDISTEEHSSLLYVSHDLLSVVRLCDRLFVLDKGRIVESLDLTNSQVKVSHPASYKLLSTLPATIPSIRRAYQVPLQSAG